jgi:hypothetical protein
LYLLSHLLYAHVLVAEGRPTTVAGDFNRDGLVDQRDLAVVLLNWGRNNETLSDEWAG